MLTPAALVVARITAPVRIGLARSVVLRLTAGLVLAVVHLLAGAAVFTGIDSVSEGMWSRVSRFSGSFFLSEIPIAWSLFGLIALVEGARTADELGELKEELDAVHHAAAQTLKEQDETEETEGRYPSRFMVRVADRIRWIRVEDVDYIAADGNYMRLHVGDKHHLVRRTMGSIESALDPDRFVRIHRSTIVNVDRVAEVHPVVGGDYTVRLIGGQQVRMSRTHKDSLLDHGV